MFLAGTHDAMPKGSFLPKKRDIGAHVGPFIDHKRLVEMTEGMSRADAYRAISAYVERAVRVLAPDEYLWSLGDAGRRAVVDLEETE